MPLLDHPTGGDHAPRSPRPEDREKLQRFGSRQASRRGGPGEIISPGGARGSAPILPHPR